MRPVPRSLAPAACIALLCVASRAEAASPVALVWTAPSECPPSAQVAAAIHRLVDPAADATASVRVARAGAGWRAEVTTTSGGATAARELHAATCRELADAAAVVIAIDVAPPSPVLAEEPTEAQPTVPEPAPPRPALPSHAGAAALRDVGVVAPTPPRRPSRWAFGGRAVGTSHPNFGTTTGAAVHAAFTPGAFRLELEGAFYPAATLERSPGSAVRQELLTAAATGCFTPRLGALRAGACVGVEGGRSRTGFGTYALVEEARGWAALRAGALVTWDLTPALAVRADFGAAMALTDDRLYVDGERLHPDGALLPRGGLGLELHFR